MLAGVERRASISGERMSPVQPKEKHKPDGVGGTEAEWEYAYRAGTRTKFYNGDDNERSEDIGQCTDNNFVSTTRFGTKLPNAFGLYDMAGHVWERCSDYWSKPYEPTGGINPQGPKTGFARSHRGGG